MNLSNKNKEQQKKRKIQGVQEKEIYPILHLLPSSIYRSSRISSVFRQAPPIHPGCELEFRLNTSTFAIDLKSKTPSANVK